MLCDSGLEVADELRVDGDAALRILLDVREDASGVGEETVRGVTGAATGCRRIREPVVFVGDRIHL